MANLLTRVLGSLGLTTKGEGDYRAPPYLLPISGGWLSSDAGSYLNWWQMGFNVQNAAPSALVEACISAYAQTVAMLPGAHWRSTDDGGRERIPYARSAITRVLRKPNGYETTSDFIMNLVRSLYCNGNAYVLAIRNARFEVTEVHLMNPEVSFPRIAYDGSIFYTLAGNDVVDYMFETDQLTVPQRDVMHLRLNRGYHTLIGESPLLAAARDIAANDAMAAQQLQFYLNQARPSIVLSTDMILDGTQVQELRDRWDAQTRGAAAGGTPILTAGLKPQAVGGNVKDAEIADMFKMTRENIALAFRVPLGILGIGGANAPDVEALNRAWLASGLGFLLNHLEEAFDALFELDGYPDEYVELDTAALLRSAPKDEIEGLVRGVQGGIYSPNEARARVELPKVAYGDEPRVQQQVVPLSAAANIDKKPTGPNPTNPNPPAPDAPPAAPSADSQPAPPKEVTDIKVKVIDGERTTACSSRLLLSRAKQISDRERISSN
jgi:HK97 family phage portal protein